jgi:hypothetical protein
LTFTWWSVIELVEYAVQPPGGRGEDGDRKSLAERVRLLPLFYAPTFRPGRHVLVLPVPLLSVPSWALGPSRDRGGQTAWHSQKHSSLRLYSPVSKIECDF